MKQPWTPGPWTTCGASDHRCACGLVWDASGSIPVAAARDGRQDDILLPADQHRANATLIAAAPDLAETLIEVVALEAHGCMTGDCKHLSNKACAEELVLVLMEMIAKARVALAKAGAR